MSIVSHDRTMSVTFFCCYPVFIVLTDCSNIFNSKSWMHAWIYANAQERVVSHFNWYYVRIKDWDVALNFLKKKIRRCDHQDFLCFFASHNNSYTTLIISPHNHQAMWLVQLGLPGPCRPPWPTGSPWPPWPEDGSPGTTWPAGPLGPIELLW